jgi:DNA-binding protein H-NS
MATRNWKLSGLGVVELVELRGQVERALRDKIDREQSTLRARLNELTALQGPSAKRGVAANGTVPAGRKPRGKSHALKGRKVPPKYRGPQGETWSGRGLAPRWLSELERKGKKRDSFLIASN